MPEPGTPRRGVVLGCGGTLGFAWSAVALAGLEQTLDWDVRTAEVLVGTSAGAEMAAALGSGRSTAQVLAALDGEPGAEPVLAAHLAIHPGMVPPVPAPALPRPRAVAAGVRRGDPLAALAGLAPRGRGDATWLRDFGDALAGPDGWVAHPATWLVAADAGTGERVAFGSPGAPTATLGEAIAASWGIPGWFPPVPIAGRRYLDGGAVSTGSADLLARLGLDEVVVIAPMTTAGGLPARGLARAERLLRSPMTKVLDREVALLEQQGTRVIRIEPGATELAAMGPNFMDLRRVPATLAAARAAVPVTIERALA
ncbi:patatin-like phospholipase family protein [Nocardioides jiangxiensis]|uniref:Patatin n=1 Tax=Nocardioides jiangxiensis TaxID=3064524 RepID=A0ABT9B124_9ACTN|nr:patatin-like phospholipase family protein [Nocardioides sp. WY-20]MDO7868019.1 patatin [Nocardioides sp. WY-20]